MEIVVGNNISIVLLFVLLCRFNEFKRRRRHRRKKKNNQHGSNEGRNTKPDIFKFQTNKNGDNKIDMYK